MHTISELARGTYCYTGNGREVRTIKRHPKFRADSLGIRLARDGSTPIGELPVRRGGDHYEEDYMACNNCSTSVPDHQDGTGVPGIRLVFDLTPPRRQAKE